MVASVATARVKLRSKVPSVLLEALLAMSLVSVLP
jgi:hypothetical protein